MTWLVVNLNENNAFNKSIFNDLNIILLPLQNKRKGGGNISPPDIRDDPNRATQQGFRDKLIVIQVSHFPVNHAEVRRKSKAKSLEWNIN